MCGQVRKDCAGSKRNCRGRRSPQAARGGGGGGGGGGPWSRLELRPHSGPLMLYSKHLMSSTRSRTSRSYIGLEMGVVGAQYEQTLAANPRDQTARNPPTGVFSVYAFFALWTNIAKARKNRFWVGVLGNLLCQRHRVRPYF